MSNVVPVRRFNTIFDHVNVDYDWEYKAVWVNLKYPGRPCMTRALLHDVDQVQREVKELAEQGYKNGDENRMRYQVLTSSLPGVFNLGGDLAHFIDLIKRRDRQGLLDYATSCIDILFPSSQGYGIPFTTITLVQGEALGGGFEAALSSNVLVAEEGATFGFPETVFGMFPGMGALSFLSRKLAPALAKRIVASGKVYSAAELYEMGVVDVLAPAGEGRQAVINYIRHQQTRENGFVCLDKVMDQINPVTYQELMNITTLWVDAALDLTDKNLRLMSYLVNAQERRWNAEEETTQQVAG